ncbi:MAG: hypothetical protein ACOYK6_00060 [Chthoniobacterales bacterium]
MKILLTLDLHEPLSPERANSENLLRLIWDQLQVTGIPTEYFLEPAPAHTLATWTTQASSMEKYLRRTPSPLTSYDLIIGVNLPPGAEALFTSLKIKTLIIRPMPCAPFARAVLVRSNFPIAEDFFISLPNLKNLYQQNFWGKNKSPDERAWWLANRFLINQGRNDALILFLGTSVLQTERIRSGSIINLATYVDPIMELLKSCPNFFYCSALPMDHSELRFMKQLGATCPSLTIPHLFARDEFDFLVSIDSAFVPIAKAFNKRITILGSQPTWSTMKVRQFCSEDFLLKIMQESI